MAERDVAILTVPVAAQLTGMHAQTVCQYDRLGLVQTKRARGGRRRCSLNDVDRLLEIQRLSQDEGIDLTKIAESMLVRDCEQKPHRHTRQLGRVAVEQRKELESQRSRKNRVPAVGDDGSVFVVTRESTRSQLSDAKP